MIPEVTVIIATYNSSRTLQYALRSLLAQDFENFEAWVVGDASTDDSEEVVTSFVDPRLNWVNLPINSGSQGDPNNEGLSRARGEYIAYLGHDDLWFPWHLSSLLTTVKKTGADLVHPLIVLKEPSLSWAIGPVPDFESYDDFHVPPSGWLHKRRIYDEGLRWPDHRRLETGVDHAFLGEISKRGYKIHFQLDVSVLKFASAAWRTYDQDADIPQYDYFQRLKKNPGNLKQELLLDLATDYALAKRRFLANLANKRLTFTRRILRKISRWYGRHRWPLSAIRVRRFQKIRKRERTMRGL